MTNGYPIFEWSPGILITDKYYKAQNEDDQISSTYEDENDEDNTGNGEQ